jgi:sulfite reductase (NADPH) flavoprotein alpha-component
MLIKRKKIKTSILNKITIDIAEYIVLVGSNTGTNIQFATAFENALSKTNKKVFVTKLNDYTRYKKAKNLIIFAATYGAGEAPENAFKFLKLLTTIQQKNELKYKVLGFGSTKYSAFC